MGRNLATALLAALGIASFAACVYATKNAPATAFYTIFCRFWELAVGCVLYQLTAQSQVTRPDGVTVLSATRPWVGATAIITTLPLPAQQHFRMFDQLSAETGVAVSVYTFPGCGFLDLRLPMNIGRGPGCMEFSQAATKDVSGNAKAGDIVFMASLRQPRFTDQWAAFVEADVLTAIRNELSVQWLQQARDEAPSLLQPFFVGGLTVLIDAPNPCSEVRRSAAQTRSMLQIRFVAAV